MSQNQTENRLIVKYRTLEETYVFSDGTDFTKTGGTYAAGDVTWAATFTSWKDTAYYTTEKLNCFGFLLKTV